MNRKQRLELIKSITTIGDEIETNNFGIQPVVRMTNFNCYLKPSGKEGVRYAWTSIHDLLKDKIIRFADQHKQAKIDVSFNRS